MLALIGGRLVESADAALPSEFISRVAAARTAARAAGLAQQVETSELLELLEGRGIQAVALKGTGLAEAAHGDIGLRVSGDIDLLVPAGELHEAVAGLRNAGYSAPLDPVGRDGFPALHFRLDHPLRTSVELHWRVHWYEPAFSADLLAARDEAMWGGALLLFYARDGFYGLRMASDLAGWWDRHEVVVGGGLLDEHVRRYPALARTWHVAAVVAERVVGVPATAWLTGARLPDRRSRLAARLSNWNESGDPDQLAANVASVDGLLAPPSALPAVVRRELQTAPDGQRLRHVAKKGSRCAAGLWRVRRRWWSPVPG